MSSTTQRRSRLQYGYCIGVSRRSAQATVGKGLAQGPYMAARARVEPTTLRLKAIDSTNAPPCCAVFCNFNICFVEYSWCTCMYVPYLYCLFHDFQTYTLRVLSVGLFLTINLWMWALVI